MHPRVLPRALALVVAVLLLTAAAARAQTHTGADLATRLYGTTGGSATLSSNPTVGTTAAIVAKNAPGRAELLIVNLSTGSCYAAPSATVSSTNGILIAASGGFVLTTVRDDLTLPDQQWWAVCANASSQLYVQEVDLQ